MDVLPARVWDTPSIRRRFEEPGQDIAPPAMKFPSTATWMLGKKIRRPMHFVKDDAVLEAQRILQRELPLVRSFE
jgi:hypothetical protein